MVRNNSGKIQPIVAIIVVIFLLPLVFAGIALFNLFIASRIQIIGQAMSPTLADGQQLLVNKISYQLTEPKRGDIVVYRSTQNSGVESIKRIVGLPGEQIVIKDGSVYINGQILNESYLSSRLIYPGEFLFEDVLVTIPENSYIVMNDDRSNVSDSRTWGFLPKNNIVGKIFFR